MHQIRQHCEQSGSQSELVTYVAVQQEVRAGGTSGLDCEVDRNKIEVLDPASPINCY